MTNTQQTYISHGEVHALDTQVLSTDKAQTTASVIHGKTTAGGGSYIDVKVSPSGELQIGGDIQVSDASGTPINPATDESLTILQSMLIALERIASQSPRLTRSKEVNVAMDNFGQAYTTSVINTTSNPVNGNITYRTNEVNYFSNMGANYLYNNIK